MDYKIISKNRKYKKLVEFLLPSMIYQLGLGSSKMPIVVTIENELDREGATVIAELPGEDPFVFVTLCGKLSPRLLASALSHEMVHVKQFVTGKLRTAKNGDIIWAGKVFKTKGVDYLDLPWEVQAFGKQEIIARRAIEGTARRSTS